MRTRRRLSDRAPEGYDERDGELQDEAVEEETTEYSLPEVAIMIGRVVSIEVTPPAEIGASGPQNLARSGARSSVAISL